MRSETNKWGNEHIKYQKKIDWYVFFVIIMLCLLTALIIGLIVFTQRRVRTVETYETTYDRHYMFVNQTGNSYVSDKIYKEAKLYGQKNGVYVEQLGSFLNAHYDSTDYLKMAMAMKVDGIILEGTDDDEVRKYINEASDLGIPAVTILSDSAGSRRKSFIELGDYNLGREYARVIIHITKTRNPKVVLLMERTEDESGGRVQQGIRETLNNEGNHLDVEFRTEMVKTSAKFRLSDRVKEILQDEEERPDILICMNEKDTQMVYQSIIDYDLEGEVQIIGACVSESLMKAVRDGGVSALIDVDTAQMGMLCIDALNCYIEEGSVNEHIIVDDIVITSENVERYMEDD